MPKTIKLKGNGEIRTSRIEIDVPHKGKIITFVYPIRGIRGTSFYWDVMNQIRGDNLLRPTTAQTFSLLDLMFQNQEETHCRRLLSRFKKDYLWTSTESLCFPEGVVVYDNVDGKMPRIRNTNSSELSKKLLGNKSVRFVEPGFKVGEMSISEFLKNPYVIAQVGGEDMIETVERVLEKCPKKYPKRFYKKNEKNRTFLSALDRYESDLRELTTLGSTYRVGGIHLNSDYYGESDLGGYAFAIGVKK